MNTVEYGSGDHIIVGLHGWGGDHRTFAPLVPLLPPRWRLIAANLPGYGATPLIEPLRIDRTAELVATMIESLPAPVIVIGSCSGAVIALETALRIPQRIRRIIALDLFAFMPWYFRFFVSEPVGAIAYRMTFQTALGRKLVNIALRSRRRADTDMMASFADKQAAVTRAYLKALAQLPGPQRYASIIQPVAIVWGERTFAAVRRSIPIWRRYLRALSDHPIENAGHLLLDEAPEKVASIIFDE
ncbi:MAG: alpha/beta hydrolase [Chlorobi bacterium]|nr:alpha/beta hydrolase [Chlorobiota bacterium]